MKLLTTLALFVCAFAADASAQDRKIDTVQARSLVSYTVTVPAGEYTRVTVHGQAHTDIDLLVYDENMNLIDSDYDSTSFCIASWTPRWTGVFYVVVVNNGFRANTFTLSIE